MNDRILFCAFADSSKGFWIADGDFGQDLAVEFDAFILHAVNKLAVADTVFTSGIVDARNPKGAKIAFAIAAVAIRVLQRFDNTLLRETEAACAVMLHALGGF